MKKLISFIALLIMMRVGALAATTTGTGTVTWGFGDGSTFKKTADPSEGIFESTTDLGISISSNLTPNPSDTKNNHYYYSFKAVAATGKKKDANSVVTFTIKTANGVTFTPTSLTLKGSGRGTSGGTIDVEVDSGSTTKAVGTGWTFTREPGKDVDVDAKTGTISGLKDVSEVNIKVYIYNLDTGRSFGINEISLTGTYTKTTTEKVTTITTASTSTLAGTTWDFTNATNFASLASAVSNALDGEWTTTGIGTNDEQCSPKATETTYYTPDLIKGLGLLSDGNGNCTFIHKASDYQLKLGNGAKLVIPGCQGQYIRITYKDGDQVQYATLSNTTTLLSSGTGEVAYHVTTTGQNVEISISGGCIIKKIEVLSTDPTKETHTYKVSFKDMAWGPGRYDISKTPAKQDAINANYGLDRDVMGIGIHFEGGANAKKIDDDVRLGAEASVTITLPATATASELTFLFNNPSGSSIADWITTENTGSCRITNSNGVSYVNYKVDDPQKPIVLKHVAGKDNVLLSGFRIDYVGALGDKSTPAIAWKGDKATMDIAMKAGETFYLANNKSTYLNAAAQGWALDYSSENNSYQTRTTDKTEHVSLSTDGVIMAKHATGNDPVVVKVQYKAAEGALFNSSNELTLNITVTGDADNRNLTVSKFLYSGQVNSYKNGMDRAFKGVSLKFSGDTNGKIGNSKVVYTNAEGSSITFTKGGKMELTVDEKVKAEQRDHVGFSRVVLSCSSAPTITGLGLVPADWTATVDGNDVILMGKSTKELEMTGGEGTSFTFEKINFTYVGDDEWPAGEILEMTKCVPSFSYKTEKVWLNNVDNTTYSQDLRISPSNLKTGAITTATSNPFVTVSNGSSTKPKITTAADDGNGTITTTIQAPDKNSYDGTYFDFSSAPFKASYEVNVGKPKTSRSWVFDANAETFNTVSDKGIAKGQTLTADEKVWKDGKDYDEGSFLYSGDLLTDVQGLTNNSAKLDQTSGLFFTTSADEQLSVKQNEFLRASNAVAIRIGNVKKGAVVIVTAKTSAPGVEAGFVERNQTNLNVLDDDHVTSVGRQDFIMQVADQGDIVIVPSRGMYIYKIEILDKNLAYVNMTSPNTTGTNGYNSAWKESDFYGYTGFTGLNNSQRVAGIQQLETSGSNINIDITAQLWPVAHGGKLADYKGKSAYASSGVWTFTSSDETVAKVASTSGSKVTVTPLKGGSATIVAKYGGDDTYAPTYGFFELNVNDPQTFRFVNGEKFEVNDVVALPKGPATTDGTSPYLITAKENPITGKDILLTLGGWTGKTDYARGNGNPDAWNSARKDARVTTLDGFNYAINANQNASDEEGRTYSTGVSADNYATGGHYKFTGDFSEKAGLVDGTPYQLPCRGGFLKFEPLKNGELTVYIHQNGATGTKEVNGVDLFTPYGFHMRSYYVSDETGKLFRQQGAAPADYDPDYIFTHVQTTGTLEEWVGDKGAGVLNSYYSTEASADEQADMTAHQTEFEWMKGQKMMVQGTDADGNVTFTPGSATLASAVISNANTNQGLYDHDGGQTAITEAQTKLSFKVKAGKTYFVFGQGTKVGFFGFKFVPDASFSATDTPELTAESETKFAYPSLKANTYHKVPNTFKKSLNQNQWNAVCLPFTMNEVQTKEAFGDDVEIIDLEDVDDHKITFKKHQYQMIIAGRPYLVWSSKSQMGIPTTPVSYDSQAEEPGKVQARSGNNYALIGNYAKIGLPKNCYVLNSKSVVLQNAAEDGKNTLKGYRAYINSADGSQLARKAFVISFGGIDEVVTGIQEVVADLANPQTSGNVYSLSGVKVSSKGLQNLPAGVYIMNGNKYVVK